MMIPATKKSLCNATPTLLSFVIIFHVIGKGCSPDLLSSLVVYWLVFQYSQSCGAGLSLCWYMFGFIKGDSIQKYSIIYCISSPLPSYLLSYRYLSFTLHVQYVILTSYWSTSDYIYCIDQLWSNPGSNLIVRKP